MQKSVSSCWRLFWKKLLSSLTDSFKYIFPSLFYSLLFCLSSSLFACFKTFKKGEESGKDLVLEEVESCSYCLKFHTPVERMGEKLERYHKEIYPQGTPKLIPCSHCNIEGEKNCYFRPSFLCEKYCSEKCREEAWNRFHKVLCMRDFVSSKEAVHPIIHLFHFCEEEKRTNPLFIARIFADVKTKVEKGESLEKAFQHYLNFVSNEESSPNDDIACQLIQFTFGNDPLMAQSKNPPYTCF